MPVAVVHPHRPSRRGAAPRLRVAVVVVAGVALGAAALVGCSSGGTDAAADPTSTTSPWPAGGSQEPIHILVTNDDGYEAEGITVLAAALRKLEGVTVSVVAPVAERSGAGGRTIGPPEVVTRVQLTDGTPAHAVEGFPADAVFAAFDDLHLKPDLVVSGINAGQNVGPAVDLSGTIGAGRAAVSRGVPALAVSQGLGARFDYDAAVPYAVRWVAQHRAELAKGKAKVEVTSLNVPSCNVGDVQGMIEVPVDAKADMAVALDAQDCTVKTPPAELKTDVAAFVAGWATIGVVPSEPVPGAQP